MFHGDDQIVLLIQQGNEFQFQGAGRGKDAQTGVGRPARHRRRHRKVAVFLALVSGDIVGRRAHLLEAVIQQYAGARSPLAVDEPDLGSQQVFEFCDVQRVPGRGHQALGAPHQAYDGDGRIRQVAADVGRVVFAGLGVQQMAAGDVGLAAPQRQQSAQAAHVGRRQVDRGMTTPQEAAHEVQRQVVAADGDDGVLNLLQRAEQFHLHLSAGVHSLSVSGDPHDSVGADQGHDHAGAPLHRGRDHLVADAPHRNTQKLVLAGGRRDLAGDVRADPAARGHRRPQQPFQQRHQQQFRGQGRRYGVAGQPHDRLVVCHAERHRMPGTDGDAMYLQAAQRFDHRCGVVRIAGGGTGVDGNHV